MKKWYVLMEIYSNERMTSTMIWKYESEKREKPNWNMEETNVIWRNVREIYYIEEIWSNIEWANDVLLNETSEVKK